MPYKILSEEGDWIVQVQRGGQRRTKRGTGGEREAKRCEAQLLAQLESETQRKHAARVLGVEEPSEPTKTAFKKLPTLRDFYCDRWVKHAEVVQNARTRARGVYAFQYVLYYLGDKRLDELCEPRMINEFVESMVKNGPMSFAKNRDGSPRKILATELTNVTINKSLQGIRSLLYLAHQEKLIPNAPSINLLPEDDSDAIVPPTEQQFQHLLEVCESFHAMAPLLRAVVEFAAETGLRPGEVFALTWKSVDLVRSCVRIETQARVKMVNGKPWKPKWNKFREVPLSERARAIIDARHADAPHEPTDLVFPNDGGTPYIRMDYAGEGAGKGYFRDAVRAAGLKGSVTFKHMRHLFAVRLLTRGVPITVVSDLLGHSNIQLTVKRYGRFASDAKVKWDAVGATARHTPVINSSNEPLR